MACQAGVRQCYAGQAAILNSFKHLGPWQENETWRNCANQGGHARSRDDQNWAESEARGVTSRYPAAMRA